MGFYFGSVEKLALMLMTTVGDLNQVAGLFGPTG